MRFKILQLRVSIKRLKCNMLALMTDKQTMDKVIIFIVDKPKANKNNEKQNNNNCILLLRKMTFSIFFGLSDLNHVAYY